MRWSPRRGQSDLEDRRGLGGRSALGAGATVVILLLSVAFKQDFFALIGASDGAPSGGSVAPAASSPAEDSVVQFVEFVVGDAQDTWSTALGPEYRRARVVLFRGGVQSGCGDADAAMGPFYCPADERVYLDLGFFDELSERFGAPGDFAQAYVLAHEVGHHIQHLLGTDAAVRDAGRRRPEQANGLSVALELQADCFAGIWASTAAQRDLLEIGDVEEGLGAASAVGDDRIQRMTRGQVDPDSFTHGSAADRSRWFKRGFDTGRVDACDTFEGGGLPRP